MTPDEFKAAMLKLAGSGPDQFGEYSPADCETAHADMDDLLCHVLTELGYGAGVEIFNKTDKWYA